MLSQLRRCGSKVSTTLVASSSKLESSNTIFFRNLNKFPQFSYNISWRFNSSPANNNSSSNNNDTSGTTTTPIDNNNNNDEDSDSDVEDPFNMHVICDLCVIPMGISTTSVSKEIAIVQKIIEKSGLTYLMHGYGTNIEGKWDDVMTLIKEIHTELHEMYEVPRISTSIKLGTRTDKKSSIQSKIDAVESRLSSK